MKKLLLSVLCLLTACLPVQADESDIKELREELQKMQSEFSYMQQNYLSMMQQMQEKIERLEFQKSTSVSQYEEQLTALQSQVEELSLRAPESSGVSKMLETFNPKISVMGDFIYKSTDLDDGEGDNQFNFREVELAFSANVDTYARGDFFVAIENEDGVTEVALEEGYLTLLETPVDNLQGKFGKFRPYFGKANRLHLHNMPWVDYPKVVQSYLGEEGFSEAGASLSYLIPTPWDVFSELTIEAFNNNDSKVFGGGEDSSAVILGHLKEFIEFNDTTTLEVGGSYMAGENDNGDVNNTQLSGADVTLKWQSDNPGSYKKLTSQTEVLFHRKDMIDEEDMDTWGMYSSFEYQFAKRWSAFTRYDLSDDPADNDLETESYSAGFKFAQSEYAFWRVQYTHNDTSDASDENVVWLQMDFGIGPHRAHQY
jgi:hypothetical protein